jgi:hypothetical protein
MVKEGEMSSVICGGCRKEGCESCGAPLRRKPPVSMGVMSENLLVSVVSLLWRNKDFYPDEACGCSSAENSGKTSDDWRLVGAAS